MVRVIRMMAVALGAVVLLIFLTSLLGQGPPRLSAMTTGEALGHLGLAIGLAGLIAAYFRDGMGGALAVAGFLLHAVESRRPLSHGPMWLMPIAGALFLALWWARRTGANADEDARPAPHRLTARLAGWLALGFAALVVAWLAVEMLLPAPLIAARNATVSSLAGRWEGTTRIVDEWGPPGDLALVMSVNRDGTVEGTIGAASFRNAQLQPNRSWAGGLFHIGSDYRLSGDLSGMITPRYAIRCAAFTLSLNLGSQTLDGRFTAFDCERAGRKQDTMRAAPARFRKPVVRTR